MSRSESKIEEQTAPFLHYTRRAGGRIETLIQWSRESPLMIIPTGEARALKLAADYAGFVADMQLTAAKT